MNTGRQWWAVLVVALALPLVLVTTPEPVAAAALPEFVGLTPARLLDTRPGAATVDGAGAGAGLQPPAATTDVLVLGRGGVPVAGVAAVAVNVTVVSPSMSTFVTVHPAGAARPNASNLAVVAGTTVAGMAIVRPGSGGRISLYHHAGTQHLLVDVLGWFPEGGSLTALTPARLTDTRAGAATVDGAAAGGGPLVGPVVRTIQVASRGGVPASGVAAVAVNVTAVAPSTSSYLTVYPAGAAAPLASTLNVSPPYSAANMTIVPLGADGRIAVNVPGGSLHLVVDVLAWFTDDPTFTALTPARLADTRPGQPTVDGAHAGGGPALAGSSLTFVAAGRGGVPSTGVGAVVLNLTAVRPTATTFLTAFPAGRARPLASSLNVAAGTTRANLVVVPLGPGGTVSVFQHAGAAHIVVDVVGWFAGDELTTELPTIPVEHPRIYLPRNDARLQALIAANDPTATRFLSLMASRRSLSYSSLWNSSYAMWYFALVAQLRGDSSYCDFAVGGVEWFVAAEEARIAAGSTPMVAGDSYLEVGVIVGDVAMVLDWCHDRTTAPQRARWLAYADQAVWNVWNPDDAQWGGRSRPWTGWSIDNPSNNYYYSFLRATMLLGIAGMGELASAETWLHHFRVNKIGGQLVPTFEQDLHGGGSREGTGYGTAMMRLWEIYDLWHGTTGEDLAALTGHTRASLLQFVHYVLPTLDGVSLNGDHSRDSTGEFFDYHRHYAQSLARLVGDDPLARRARWLVDHSSVTSMTSGFMVIFDFIYAGSGTPAQPLTGLNTTYHAPGVGQVYTRSSWGADAAWLNFTAGPYTESHAHRDQGSFLLYRDEWLAYDPNYHSHSGIEQEETLHNLVRITSGGATLRQWEGASSTLQALQQGPGWVHVAADSTAVYTLRNNPPVSKVQREIVWLEPGVAVVFDRMATGAGTQQIWQLNSPVRPVVNGATATFAGAQSTLTVQRVIPAAATTSVFDWSTVGGFSGGYRLDSQVAGGATTFLHVLSFGTSSSTGVSSVARNDAAGRQGVQITLADGRVAIIRFSTTGVDGTLELRSASGAVLQSVVLNSGVRALPETTG